MFQRVLLRQGQAAKSALSARPLSTVSLSQRITVPAQSSQISRQLPPLLCRRFASTESEGGKKEENAAAASGEGAEASEAAEPTQQHLQSKEREVIELKVRLILSIGTLTYACDNIVNPGVEWPKMRR